MLYDCFTFLNELDLLEIRLNILNEVVDKFVIVEATRTFSNQLKPLFFADNKERFRRFSDKIIHVVVDTYPPIESAWTIEQYQRNCIANALTACHDDDVILISDLDEIPRPEKIREYRDTQGIKVFEQSMFYYFLNYLNVTDPIWPQGTKMLSYHDFRTGTGCMEEIGDKNFLPSVNSGVTATRIRLITKALSIKDGGVAF
jgi:beta-1,4-mannosyl-glycoprotein beta-1,4-N-acetylglucosaminyltransferase